ncbi:uncharacterized protein LOC132536899 [Erinaceus europaeus]|uniref:Uncharacterized protein LOC132536899 n=1 Tax=Erinaceus europaeus TaxID=9365 RepID=A0ABM3X0L5_ERIEU|nr:uncharacterized protein LOC132536899 [Erinaceus europaeus]
MSQVPSHRQQDDKSYLHSAASLSTLNSDPGSTQLDMPEPLGTRVNVCGALPSPVHTRRVSIQEPLPSPLHMRRVSIQEPLPSSLHMRRVSIQEPSPSSLHTRRVSIQEPSPSSLYSRRVSIQEPSASSLYTRRVSIQQRSPSSLYTRRVSIQEPSASSLYTRRVSIQEPSHSRREPMLAHLHQYLAEDKLKMSHSSQVNPKNPEPLAPLRPLSTANISHGSLSCQLGLHDISSKLFHHRFSSLESPISIFTSSMMLSHMDSTILSIENNDQSQGTSTSHGWSLSLQTLPFRSRMEEPNSLTGSQTSSTKSLESSIRDAQRMSKTSMVSEEFSETSLDHRFSTTTGYASEYGQWPKHRSSQLTLSWWLLHEAKKISRQVSLVLCLLGMVVLGLISLSQPWVHFNVPLMPPGLPKEVKYIPIDTVLFVECPDTSCLHEYDQNAYLLDFSWAFIFLASICSMFLFIILVNVTFFTSSSVPMLDFSNVIISFLTVTSIILGILFYLLQARNYLQEGMTHELGPSFYLAWSGVLLFLLTGLFSYLNYMNFWSILALHAIWV